MLATLLLASSAAGQAPAPKPTFVILAPAEWHAALGPLAAARKADFEVELAALEDVVAGEGSGDPSERRS